MVATAAGAGTAGRLDLLASAIAGQLLEVAAVAPGELPWTDGALVFVDEEASRHDQVRAVAVQASLLGAGSLAPEIVARMRRRGSLARRYLAVEGHRALAVHEAVLPTSVRALVDRSTAARSDSPVASLALALSRARIAEPPAAFGAIRPRQLRATTPAGTKDEDAKHVPRQQSERLLRELDDGEEIDGESAFDMFNPIGGGGAIGRLIQRLLGTARSKGGGQPGADSPTHRTKQAGRLARGAAVPTARATSPEDVDSIRPRGTTYPEWNVYERQYRPDWCTVAELQPEVTGNELPVPLDAHTLRRSLARLGLGLERRHRQLEGDDIDVDALVEARVELAAGSAPDEAVYIDSVRLRRDLAVLILLDASGSAGEPSVTGASVHEHQVRAAAGLTVALHDLGDRVALYGFRSLGRSAVHLLPVKRFGDGLDAVVLRRLGGLVPGAYTRLGAAIRHGASVLEAEGGTTRRLLVVLSDGFAYDHGYDGPYGEADARRALAEARRRGTACLCLSVAADTDALALRRVFGTAAHAMVPHAQQLPATVGPLFRSALRLADVQRRMSQRRERTRERIEIERRTA
jgi:hypothetical protein